MRCARGARGGAVLLLGLLLALAGSPGRGAAETGTARGFLWGRFAVEEESPDGAWIPLEGVEVSVYPFDPGVLADLERIREGARDSAKAFETAVARVRDRLRAAAGEEAREQIADPAGLFVFEDLSPGEWLLVGIRLSPYAALPGDRRHARPRGRGFLTGERRAEPKKAEVWVTRVRVTAGARTRVFLSDRARWLVGPLR